MMGWPQWTFIVLLALQIGVALGMDGKPRTPFSFVNTLIGAVITWWLLWMGGFFAN